MSIYVQNKGNVVTFYRDRNYVDQDEFDNPSNYIIAIDGFMLPFQIPFTASSVPSTVSLFGILPNGTQLPLSDISVNVNDMGNNNWMLTCFGGSFTGLETPSPPGVINRYKKYQLAVSVSGNIFYSDWIKSYEDTDCLYSLSFSHSTDLDGVFYQQGYNQVMYLELHKDTNIIETDEETEENGLGEVFINKRIVTERLSFFLDDIFPDQMAALASIRHHDTVILSKKGLIDSSPVQEFDIEFLEKEDSRYVDANITHLASRQVYYPCNDNVYPNNSATVLNL